MKRIITSILLALLLLIVAGCGGVSQQEYDAVATERDQLQQRLAETMEALERVQAENDSLKDSSVDTSTQPSTTMDEDTSIGGGKKMVYICESGGKYHKQSCRYAETSIDAIGVAVAESKGYEPCKTCYPQKQ